MQVQVSLTLEIDASASLSQMEEHIQEAGRQAMRQAMKQAIRQWEEQRPSCPHCGAKQRRLEGTVRRTLATTFGRVEVPRRRFRCQQCGRRWCPATQLFAPLAGGTISAPLQEAALVAGCSWPYRVAARQLQRLGRQPRPTRRHGRQSGGGVFAHGEPADAQGRPDLLLEQARWAPTAAAPTASLGHATLCGHLRPR